MVNKINFYSVNVIANITIFLKLIYMIIIKKYVKKKTKVYQGYLRVMNRK